MKKMPLLLSLFIALPTFAETIFKIEVGQQNKKTNVSDLQERVWELERAVWQLQQKVFQLENAPVAKAADSWQCTIEAMGEPYTGTGATKAIATKAALDACKAGGHDGFFCKNPKCEQ